MIPLIALALFAWYAAVRLSEEVTDRSAVMADNMLESIQEVGKSVIEDSTVALSDRSRESIERLSTDTARAIANFLYERDQDILLASNIAMKKEDFASFLRYRTRAIYKHDEWRLADNQNHWLPVRNLTDFRLNPETADLKANARSFHHRQKEEYGIRSDIPLYREMTFISVEGKELIKTGDLTGEQLQDISNPLNTFAKAETYWPELQQLEPGEVYISEVIGTYVGSRLIGLYTPERTTAAGLPFEPEVSAYAGAENPLGKHFEGIIRWATPLLENGTVTGYVTLALDHDHIRQFTDRITPTAQRYTPISDASSGNYAFMWDYKNRAISHPRDYFIHGYNSETGLPETPWMDTSLYQSWQESGLPSHEFLANFPEFDQPSLTRKPAKELIDQGTIALDCRYLNFSPQCQGWNQLTRDGGSGSFEIYFSGLWKLTTAATIPYYTGRYGTSGKGFGFVTIGANVNEFHKAAVDSEVRISGIISRQINDYIKLQDALVLEIGRQLSQSSSGLIASTLFLTLIVIAIAILIANALTRRITSINDGMQKFHNGDYEKRLHHNSHDEMGQLAGSFNAMADNVSGAIKDLRHEVAVRRENEEQLRIAAVAFETQQGMCITDANSVILSVNHAFSEITGYSEPEAVGQTPGILRSGSYTEEFCDEIRHEMRTTGQWQGEVLSKRMNGDLFPEWLTITQVTDEAGEVTHYVRAMTDISERKASEEYIKELAYFDPLTRLPNRQTLSERLETELIQTDCSQQDSALLFIDLDNFKTLNDTAGHHYGDLLLKQVADRLTTLIRQTDTVARFGGDEFVIMLSNLDPDREQAIFQVEEITQKIVDQLNRPYSFTGFEHRITVSVGITLFSDSDHSGIDQLLQRADLAMYQAKSNGRNLVCFFDPQMQAAVNIRAELESDLHQAIKHRQFELYYQPQVNQHGRILGVEALIRWHHPAKGLISPLDFIPVAEETGQIQTIGLWVIEQACLQLKHWQQKIDSSFSISVNVSSKQYQNNNFVGDVVSIIEALDVNPKQLKMELTESVLSENVDTIIEKMWQLKELGIGFALDDFGTGYSSLSYLKKLPLDHLKIDKSFVQDLTNNASDAAIAKTIVGLSQSLNIDVIAEGVETEAQLQQLVSYGCHIYQGYLFSRPVPKDEIRFSVAEPLEPLLLTA